MDVDLTRASRELEHLARWLPLIEGRAASVGPRERSSGTHVEGRGDFIDERNQTLRKAIDALLRLEALGTRTGGERHVIVLAYCYLWLGEEERCWWGKAPGGLDARVGIVFADSSLRMLWLLNPSRMLGVLAAANSGRILREEAERAYATIETEGVNAPRIDFAALRDRLSKLVANADSVSEVLHRVREQNRVRGKRP